MPDLRLLVAGDGPELDALRRRATPNVEFLGCLEDAELVHAMQGCQAAIFPSIDDFGLVPLEVNACGRPVLALRAGGSLHTVAPGVSGEFLSDQSSAGVVRSVREFDPSRYSTNAIRQHALRWDGHEFRRGLQRTVLETIGKVDRHVEAFEASAPRPARADPHSRFSSGPWWDPAPDGKAGREAASAGQESRDPAFAGGGVLRP